MKIKSQKAKLVQMTFGKGRGKGLKTGAGSLWFCQGRPLEAVRHPQASTARVPSGDVGGGLCMSAMCTPATLPKLFPGTVTVFW